jgi:hypothetical protein
MPLACWDFFIEGMEAPCSFKSHGCDTPSMMPHHVGWISVVGMQARPLFVVSGALHESDGIKAEAPGMPHIIPAWVLSCRFGSPSWCK